MSFGIPVRNGLGVGLLASTFLSSLRIGGRPALSLDFIGTNSLDSRITFTRGTTATFVGSDGFIQTAAINAPRFDYDPITLAPKGLLIEEARTNLFLQSQTFESLSWSKILSTVSSNAANGPDNTLTADKLIPNNGATLSGAITFQDIAKAAAATTYTYSVFGKSDGYDRILLRCQDSGGSTNRANVIVNVSTGAIVTAASVGGTFTNASAKVTTYKNGYFRVELTFTSSTDTLLRSQIYALDSVATTGDGVKGILIWGAQLEAGAFATSYIPTTLLAVARGADVATMTGTNFSTWFNASAGTFVSEFDVIWTGNAPFSMGVIGLDASASKRLVYIANGAQAASSFDGTLAISTANNIGSGINKVASAYDTSRYIALNGGVVVTGTMAAGYPTSTSLDIGKYSTTNYLNGHIRVLNYYNTRLPNTTLQALTA
jgi:hypothetical protein